MASILLAEDSPTHTAMICAVLEAGSHRVRCVVDGLEALAAIEESKPDLVVTDLSMENMNGQELVQEIQSRYPRIPSIVVTARGSEHMAIDALALGAANFVPKNSISKLLNHVLRQTLKMSQVDKIYHAFPGRLSQPEFSFRLQNHIGAIEPTVLFVIQTMAAASRMNTTERIRVGAALTSAIFNAICFGNLEVSDEDTFISRLLSGEASGREDLKRRASESPYRERTVDVKVSIGKADSRISISHSGPGQLLRLNPAPGTPESFELEQCRGVMLMTSFMDDIVFHSGGTEVVMVKRHRV